MTVAEYTDLANQLHDVLTQIESKINDPDSSDEEILGLLAVTKQLEYAHEILGQETITR